MALPKYLADNHIDITQKDNTHLKGVLLTPKGNLFIGFNLRSGNKLVVELQGFEYDILDLNDEEVAELYDGLHDKYAAALRKEREYQMWRINDILGEKE